MVCRFTKALLHFSSDSEDNVDKKVVKKSGGTGQNPEANRGTKKSKGQRNKELFEVDMRTKGELTLDVRMIRNFTL